MMSRKCFPCIAPQKPYNIDIFLDFMKIMRQCKKKNIFLKKITNKKIQLDNQQWAASESRANFRIHVEN